MSEALSRLVAAAIAVVLFTLSAQANLLTRADSDRFNSLRVKLVSVTTDITEAMHQMTDKPTLVNCLSLIHNQAQSVAETATPVSSLIALGALMKDETDELLVLHELSLSLRLLTGGLSAYRKIINASMRLCSNSATVNVKGQAVLNVFTELNQEATALTKRVAQALPPSR
jgi:hypothetical protein